MSDEADKAAAPGQDTAGWRARTRAWRAQRALERQLAYQQAKLRKISGREQQLIRGRTDRARQVRAMLSGFRPIGDDARVLEVGSGAHGLIFFFGVRDGVGVDPLADHCRGLFPAWQDRARTIAAAGEALPFPDASFDLVLCDNVVDHAADPARIVEEMARVLAPGGLLYFTVNVHHPLYHVAAVAHAGWQSLRLPGEIGPFADHTVHLTPAAAARLFDSVPLRRLSHRTGVEEAKRKARDKPLRHAGDLLKRIFYKNAVFELIAQRKPSG
ncbi:MAG: class I SAM-dependent methyltransferase [Gammaproteobacteria bacterium]